MLLMMNGLFQRLFPRKCQSPNANKSRQPFRRGVQNKLKFLFGGLLGKGCFNSLPGSDQELRQFHVKVVLIICDLRDETE